MQVCSIEKLCDVLAISRQAIAKLVDSGIVVRAKPGKYDLAASARNYIALIKARAEPGLVEARTELTLEKLRIAKIERLRLEGEFVPLAEVRVAWNWIINIVRTRLIAVPHRCFPRLGMCEGRPLEICALMDEEQRAALETLSDLTLMVKSPTGELEYFQHGKKLTTA